MVASRATLPQAFPCRRQSVPPAVLQRHDRSCSMVKTTTACPQMTVNAHRPLADIPLLHEKAFIGTREQYGARWGLARATKC